MIKSTFGWLVASMLILLACSAQIPEVQEPVLPADGTPVLVERNGVYEYDSVTPQPSATLEHEMVMASGVVLTLMTPPGWTARRVNNGLCLEHSASGAQFVVYPPRRGSHEKQIRDYHEFDTEHGAQGVSELHSYDSDCQPFLYTIRRTRDGRSGLMYALLTVANDEDSGIVVTGIWPIELDHQLRPIVVSAVNSVRLRDL